MELLLYILSNVFWPLKGIIMMEERFILYTLSIGLIYFGNFLGVVFIMVFAIVLAITLNLRRTWNGFLGFMATFIVEFIAFIFNITFAWFYLVYGAINGRMNESHVPRRLTVRRNRHRVNIAFVANNPGIHYRLGRGIYRLFYRFFSWIIHSLNLTLSNTMISATSRIFTLIVILWGIWYLPGDIANFVMLR